ncbi:MAG: hypothetical protein JNK15_14680 [Planctomycetes bacterium]|nr:hypothetical protein [Planctomycetota bacterium]
MGPLVLCLVAVLSPQQTAATAPPTATPTAATQDPVVAPAHADAVALAAIERAPAEADPVELARLAGSADAKVAERAAFLLASRKDRPAYEPMRTVARQSPHAGARVQAMHGVLRIADVGSTTTGIEALQDPDRRVRTLAAQLLGTLKRPTAVEPLLAAIEGAPQQREPGPATDLQACVLALHDLGAHEVLLRVATRLHDLTAEGTGPVLAFACQGLLPKMQKEQQTTFLLAILAHREPVVRRFAIAELSARKDPSTAKALEGRLAAETDELRPLVELALANVRQDRSATRDELGRARHNFDLLVASATKHWQALLPWQQGCVAGIPVLLVALWLFARARARRAAAAAAAAETLALVAPSESLADEAAPVDESIAEVDVPADPMAATGEYTEQDEVAVGADDAGWQQDEQRPS